MGHSYYSYQGHCPGFTGSGGKSGRLELRAKLPLFTRLPVRGLRGNRDSGVTNSRKPTDTKA